MDTNQKSQENHTAQENDSKTPNRGYLSPPPQ
jgi:hypothetical protein